MDSPLEVWTNIGKTCENKRGKNGISYILVEMIFLHSDITYFFYPLSVQGEAVLYNKSQSWSVTSSSISGFLVDKYTILKSLKGYVILLLVLKLNFDKINKTFFQVILAIISSTQENRKNF